MQVLGMVMFWIMLVAFFGFVGFLICMGGAVLWVKIHDR